MPLLLDLLKALLQITLTHLSLCEFFLKELQLTIFGLDGFMLRFTQNFKLFCQQLDLLLMLIARQFETDCLLTIRFSQLLTVHKFRLRDSQVLLEVLINPFQPIHVVLELLIL